MVSPKLWTKCAENSLDGFPAGSNVVFDDVRFEDEAELIRSKGGVIVHLRRHTQNIDYHASEAGIAVMEQDLVLDNSGTLADTLAKLHGFLAWLV
jgi:hypothetical protein